MAELSFEILGIEREELIDRVVEKIADRALQDWSVSSDGGRACKSFAALIEDRVVDATNRAIEEIAARNVLPNVASYVENLCLQETNKWGEKTGKKQTFVEYLVARAETWITEPVDYQGKPKGTDSFSWHARGTRIAHMIHEHLDLNIRLAIKGALEDLNNSVAKGVRDTVMIQIREVLNRLKVKVDT
jgi:hypothetical protein